MKNISDIHGAAASPADAERNDRPDPKPKSIPHPLPRLQVLIATMGEEGIRRVAAASHPRVEGVGYLVAWQLPEGDCEIPPTLSERPDFTFVKTSTRGLSRNRNISIEAATAPLCLISDDDIDYTEDELLSVIQAFEANPACDLLTFRYRSEGDGKVYPEKSCYLDPIPKGYWLTSFELAFRRKKIISKGLRFDERFGIGGRFIAGEEELFLHSMLRNGLKGRFLPITIATHNGQTTATREAANHRLIETKGAMITLLHPATWPLRLLAHLRRNARAPQPHLSTATYLRAWLRGVRDLHR